MNVTTLRICPECKRYYSGNYCTKCGTKLEAIPTCKCGSPIFRNDEYCSSCGGKVPEKLYYGWPC